MSYTKYVMTQDGKFVMISKLAGLDHSQLSLLLPEEPVSAGFISLEGGKLIAYGQSITLAMRSREQDSEIIQAALDEGAMKFQWDDLCDRYFAGNIDHITMGEDVLNIEALITKEVLES